MKQTEKKAIVPKETVLVNPFFDEPKEYNVKNGDKFRVYEHGEIFENVMNGVLQKIKPFVGLSTKAGGWTEIGVGLLSENGDSVFWGIHDFKEGRRVSYYPRFKESMDYFKDVKEIKSDTCAHCYYVATGKMSLIEGKFILKIQPPQEKTENIPETTVYKKKNNFWKWLFWIMVISAIIWFIF